jgi:hypothetical protein
MEEEKRAIAEIDKQLQESKDKEATFQRVKE